MLGFHDHYSALIKVYFLKRKSDTIQAMKLFVARCNSMGFAFAACIPTMQASSAA